MARLCRCLWFAAVPPLVRAVPWPRSAAEEAGRAEGTIRRQRVVLDRFAAFLAGRGLDTASDRVCIDFIANQTGVRLGSLREPVSDRAVQAV